MCCKEQVSVSDLKSLSSAFCAKDGLSPYREACNPMIAGCCVAGWLPSLDKVSEQLASKYSPPVAGFCLQVL